MREYTIDPELRDLIPPLSKEERQGLESSIKSEGCRDSIVVWKDVIVDGHNRYEICTKNKIPFRVHNIEFPDKDSAIDWMYTNQLSRRNLTDTMKMVLIGKQYAHRKKRDWSRHPVRGQNDPLPKTAETIAQEQGVSEKTVKRAEKLAEAVETIGDLIGPEAKQEILKETVKVSQKELLDIAQELREKEPEKLEEIKEKSKTGIKNAGLFTSETDEWYTPPEIIISVVGALGSIDVDPCSNGNTIPAKTHYTKEDDGLSKAWVGTVYMNPPYGNVIGDWVQKALSEYLDGAASEVIILVPARTDTAWFQSLVSYPWCAVKGRLKFSENKNSAPFPSAIFYLGENVKAFFENFECFGPIFRRVDHLEADVS